MSTVTQTLRELIDSRFGGVLSHGSHEPDGVACALEAVSVLRGIAWTDKPDSVGMPDLRPINDAPWSSDAARTDAMVPMIEALLEWRDWPHDRRAAWAGRVALRTVREILPMILRERWPSEADACAGAEILSAAAKAAGAAMRAAKAAAKASAQVAYVAAWAAVTTAAPPKDAAAWAADVAMRASAEAAAKASAQAAYVAAWAAVTTAAPPKDAAAAKAATYAAQAAARAAASYAAAYAAAAADDILRLACRIWTEEAAR